MEQLEANACSRFIFGEKTEVAFCRTFRTAAAAAAAAATAAAAAAALRDMLRKCNPGCLSLGGVIQEGSC